MTFLLRRFFFWWKQNPVRGGIVLTVLASHLFAIIFITSTATLKAPKPKTAIIVRTLQPHITPTTTTAPQKTAEHAKQQINKPPLTKPAPPKKAPPAPAKKTAEKPVKKQAPQKKAHTPPAKKTPPPPPPLSKDIEKSLKEIEESIAKIAANSGNIPPKKSPNLHPPLKSFCLSEELGEDYSASLIEYLQMHLRLPDKGEVKIELKLRRDGRIEAVKVLSAESEKNKTRIEKLLPTLHLPPLPKGDGEDAKVFILTFCNDL